MNPNYLTSFVACLCTCYFLAATPARADAPLELNDAGYFETRGLNVLVFSNWYNGLFDDSKISGIELIHHGVRTATNGDVRLNATPEQWDAIPEFIERRVGEDGSSVEAFLKYPAYDFFYSIRVSVDQDIATISVNLTKPLPEALAGRAGLNLEFLPSAYFEKSFLVDEHPGVFPLYPSGPKEQNGAVEPVPLASGKILVLAPDDPERRVMIDAGKGNLKLFDGRSKAQNGWFVVRSLIPAGQSGTVVEWTLAANTIDGWTRPPSIAHSQVGYHPAQQKIAVIELDGSTPDEEIASIRASLYRVESSGNLAPLLQSVPSEWGRYKRYRYLSFDFSAVDREGIYVLVYGDVKTTPFRIATDVYDSAWHPTLDVYMPVQMDHVLVNEAYRVWHGASHLDDALQAPVDHRHFDLYAQGPTTDTDFEPGQHIPGLNIGGWYDAGDYDIRTQSQYGTVLGLVNTWELFTPLRDTTTVDYPQKLVDLHVPDGKPDLLQQIEHGTLALIAQHRVFGRAIPGIIVPDLSQYTHLGDGLTMTDNLIYDSDMGPLESNGIESGRFDDRWAFTSRSSALNYGSIAALAAASRALAGYNDALANECLESALSAWNEEQSHEPYLFRHGNTTGGPLESEKLQATVQLLLTTGENRFAVKLQEQMPEIETNFGFHAALAVQALPFMNETYAARIRSLAEANKERLDGISAQNPFGVLITEGGWAGNGAIMGMAVTNYWLHRAFPEIIGREEVFKGLNYLYGTHPDSDISFVSNVGTRSKRVAYGMNRADFSFISGGIVPGVLILKPDFPENKEDWPFLWGENEYVIPMAATYIFLVHAAGSLLQE